MNGGEIVADVLAGHGVQALFTLCGGHISPILVGCHERGIRVIDTRHEANAVFAADAVSRLTNTVGVAAVTAGPGVTNTITAVTNARLAQSPLIVLGGATAGILKGRGALQDIDQTALVRSQMKWCATARRVRDIKPLLETAFRRAQDGVPGPVFLELPVDLLYGETLVREWFGKSAKGSRLQQWYVAWYLRRLFGGSVVSPVSRRGAENSTPHQTGRSEALALVAQAQRPLLIAGSQVANATTASRVSAAIEALGIPLYLSGMARGLVANPLRHRRKEALRKADLVILAGVPADFRLNYGRDIPRHAKVIAINRSATDLKKNIRPHLAVQADPGEFLLQLSAVGRVPCDAWIEELRAADGEREQEIADAESDATDGINPISLCRAIDRVLAPDSIVVADGGDFVGTASYIVRPRAPLSWLDPGPFGTLGVGAGFAIGAAVSRPDSEVWILYGDGAVGFSLAEFDTFVRHRIPLIAVVANDGCWSQIHREQVETLGDDTGCMLARTDYQRAAEGLGARGLLLRDPADIEPTLRKAQQIAREGHAVLINAWIGKSAFRKGSISV